MNGCRECDAQKNGETPLLHRSGGFVVHPVLGGGAVPGWLVVAPERHVTQVDALTDEEAAALGPLLKRVGAALREATGGEKLYVAAFGELLPHFHVHLIARPDGFPREERGGRIFASEKRADPAEIERVAERVRELLAGSKG